VPGQKSRVSALPGHHWAVNALSFSPDGKKLASGGCDGMVILWEERLWEAQCGEAASARHPRDYEMPVGFCPAGHRASGVWQMGVQRRAIPMGSQVQSLAFGHDWLRAHKVPPSAGPSSRGPRIDCMLASCAEAFGWHNGSGGGAGPPIRDGVVRALGRSLVGALARREPRADDSRCTVAIAEAGVSSRLVHHSLLLRRSISNRRITGKKDAHREQAIKSCLICTSCCGTLLSSRRVFDSDLRALKE